MSALFIIVVSLTMTLFSQKLLLSNIYMHLTQKILDGFYSTFCMQEMWAIIYLQGPVATSISYQHMIVWIWLLKKTKCQVILSQSAKKSKKSMLFKVPFLFFDFLVQSWSCGTDNCNDNSFHKQINSNTCYDLNSAVTGT